MKELSADDLVYGTTRHLLTFQGSGIGEDGYYNLQQIEGAGIMSMNANGGASEGEGECEEALIECNDALIECNDALKGCNDALIKCEAEVGRLEGKIGCLEDLITPETLAGGGGVGAWSHSATTFRPDYGPPNPSCTYEVSSSISVVLILPNTGRWTRVNAPKPAGCVAAGSIVWTISPNKDGSDPLPIPWSGNPGQDSVTDYNLFLDTTYYVFGNGSGLEDGFNGVYSQPIQNKGSFFVSGTGEITRTIDVTVSVTDGEAPCE